MNNRIVNPKFTKGEKCIFGHLVLTFSCILVLAIIYLIHLYVIHHGFTGVFNTRRSSPQNKAPFTFDNVPIGILFLNQNPAMTICNTLLLSWQWSVGPAHCIAMRSHPDLSDSFKAWTIRYKFNSDKRIKRSIIHPHFNSDTFVNNIGIVHHDSIHSLQEHKIFNFRYNGLNTNMSNDIFIASWNYENQNKGNDFSNTSESFTKSLNNKRNIRFIKFIEKSVSSVHLIDLERCMAIMTPIIELRDYEFCVNLKKHRKIFLVHGAVIINLRGKEILGFFSWGEKQPSQSLPLVILNLTYYREWLKIVSL